MAILRKKEIRELSPEERKSKLDELEQELMKQQSKLASTGIPDNSGRLREIKKTIARILTIDSEVKAKNVRDM